MDARDNASVLIQIPSTYVSNLEMMFMCFVCHFSPPIFKIESFNSLEEIERYKNKEIFINSKDLPKLKENEFYWKDLIGKEVELENGTFVGVVTEIIETGSDDVLVVEKENKKELIPFNFGEVIKKVSDDLIIVDWHT